MSVSLNYETIRTKREFKARNVSTTLIWLPRRAANRHQRQRGGRPAASVLRKRAAQTGYRLRAGAKRARATAAQAGHGPRPGSSVRAGAKPLARHSQGGHGGDGADGFDGRTQQTIITDIYNIGVSSCSKLTETTDLAGVLHIFATILHALSGRIPKSHRSRSPLRSLFGLWHASPK